MSSRKFSNSKAAGFLRDIPVTSVENSRLVSKSKFNFHYMDLAQPAELKSELSLDFLNELLEKLKNFSENSLAHWVTMPAGRGNGNVLQIYGKFPSKSDFTHPKSVPHDAVWARFRMDRTVRLAGFMIPSELNNQPCPQEKFRYCSNTFYVVYIDLHHRFFITD